MSTPLDRKYVLQPFNDLIAACHSTVLLGLRLLEKVRTLPGPTAEELQFFQFIAELRASDSLSSKALFKRWLLLKGFGDDHKCINTALQRFITLITIGRELRQTAGLDVEARRRELRDTLGKQHFPVLLEKAGSLCSGPLDLEEQIKSFNLARNCLEHGSGEVVERFCNSPAKNALIVSGRRFRLFFSSGDNEVAAVFGMPGPENAALMLSAEEFEIHFALGQSLDMSLKHFIDVLNTCVFLRADLDIKLAEEETRGSTSVHLA